jgi:hypothetical protein
LPAAMLPVRAMWSGECIGEIGGERSEIRSQSRAV